MSLGPERVLILEDDPATLAIMVSCCARLGLTPLTCADVSAARALIGCEPLAVALVDHHLGGQGLGLDFLVALQEQEPDCCRILCSASADSGLLVDAINRGHVDAFLSKPVHPEACLGLVGKGIEITNLRRKNRSLVSQLEVNNQELAAAVADRTQHLEEVSRRLQEKHHELVRLETQSALGNLVRGLAHELNNPLAAILGYAQRLARGSADAENRRKLDIIVSEVDRCRSLVEQLRRLAAPVEEDCIPLDPAEVAVRAACRLAEQHGRICEIHIPDETIPVQAGPRSLERIFEQVLLNATQADARNLDLRTEMAYDRVQIHCDNDGATPSANEIANATRPFFTTRSTTGGRGLGLAIAAGLLREQDGTLSLDRRPDGRDGARITLSLPLAAGSGRYHRLRRVESKPQVLVVDDEPLIAELLADCLAEIGCDVRTVDSVKGARDLLGKQALRAVIVDMHLPDGSGIDLLRQALRDHPHLNGHVALVTGDAHSNDLHHQAQRDGLPILHKPFRLEEMTEFVARLL